MAMLEVKELAKTAGGPQTPIYFLAASKKRKPARKSDSRHAMHKRFYCISFSTCV